MPHPYPIAQIARQAGVSDAKIRDRVLKTTCGGVRPARHDSRQVPTSPT